MIWCSFLALLKPVFAATSVKNNVPDYFWFVKTIDLESEFEMTKEQIHDFRYLLSSDYELRVKITDLLKCLSIGGCDGSQGLVTGLRQLMPFGSITAETELCKSIMKHGNDSITSSLNIFILGQSGPNPDEALNKMVADKAKNHPLQCLDHISRRIKRLGGKAAPLIKRVIELKAPDKTANVDAIELKAKVQVQLGDIISISAEEMTAYEELVNIIDKGSLMSVSKLLCEKDGTPRRLAEIGLIRDLCSVMQEHTVLRKSKLFEKMKEIADKFSTSKANYDYFGVKAIEEARSNSLIEASLMWPGEDHPFRLKYGPLPESFKMDRNAYSMHLPQQSILAEAISRASKLHPLVARKLKYVQDHLKGIKEGDSKCPISQSPLESHPSLEYSWSCLLDLKDVIAMSDEQQEDFLNLTNDLTEEQNSKLKECITGGSCEDVPTFFPNPSIILPYKSIKEGTALYEAILTNVHREEFRLMSDYKWPPDRDYKTEVEGLSKDKEDTPLNELAVEHPLLAMKCLLHHRMKGSSNWSESELLAIKDAKVDIKNRKSHPYLVKQSRAKLKIASEDEKNAYGRLVEGVNQTDLNRINLILAGLEEMAETSSQVGLILDMARAIKYSVVLKDSQIGKKLVELARGFDKTVATFDYFSVVVPESMKYWLRWEGKPIECRHREEIALQIDSIKEEITDLKGKMPLARARIESVILALEAVLKQKFAAKVTLNAIEEHFKSAMQAVTNVPIPLDAPQVFINKYFEYGINKRGDGNILYSLNLSEGDQVKYLQLVRLVDYELVKKVNWALATRYDNSISDPQMAGFVKFMLKAIERRTDLASLKTIIGDRLLKLQQKIGSLQPKYDIFEFMPEVASNLSAFAESVLKWNGLSLEGIGKHDLNNSGSLAILVRNVDDLLRELYMENIYPMMEEKLLFAKDHLTDLLKSQGGSSVKIKETVQPSLPKMSEETMGKVWRILKYASCKKKDFISECNANGIAVTEEQKKDLCYLTQTFFDKDRNGLLRCISNPGRCEQHPSDDHQLNPDILVALRVLLPFGSIKEETELYKRIMLLPGDDVITRKLNYKTKDGREFWKIEGLELCSKKSNQIFNAVKEKSDNHPFLSLNLLSCSVKNGKRLLGFEGALAEIKRRMKRPDENVCDLTFFDWTDCNLFSLKGKMEISDEQALEYAKLLDKEVANEIGPLPLRARIHELLVENNSRPYHPKDVGLVRQLSMVVKTNMILKGSNLANALYWGSLRLQEYPGEFDFFTRKSELESGESAERLQENRLKDILSSLDPNSPRDRFFIQCLEWKGDGYALGDIKDSKDVIIQFNNLPETDYKDFPLIKRKLAMLGNYPCDYLIVTHEVRSLSRVTMSQNRLGDKENLIQEGLQYYRLGRDEPKVYLSPQQRSDLCLLLEGLKDDDRANLIHCLNDTGTKCPHNHILLALKLMLPFGSIDRDSPLYRVIAEKATNTRVESFKFETIDGETSVLPKFGKLIVPHPLHYVKVLSHSFVKGKEADFEKEVGSLKKEMAKFVGKQCNLSSKYKIEDLSKSLEMDEDDQKEYLAIVKDVRDPVVKRLNGIMAQRDKAIDDPLIAGYAQHLLDVMTQKAEIFEESGIFNRLTALVNSYKGPKQYDYFKMYAPFEERPVLSNVLSWKGCDLKTISGKQLDSAEAIEGFANLLEKNFISFKKSMSPLTPLIEVKIHYAEEFLQKTLDASATKKNEKEPQVQLKGPGGEKKGDGRREGPEKAPSGSSHQGAVDEDKRKHGELSRKEEEERKRQEEEQKRREEERKRKEDEERKRREEEQKRREEERKRQEEEQKRREEERKRQEEEERKRREEEEKKRREEEERKRRKEEERKRREEEERKEEEMRQEKLKREEEQRKKLEEERKKQEDMEKQKQQRMQEEQLRQKGERKRKEEAQQQKLAEGEERKRLLQEQMQQAELKRAEEASLQQQQRLMDEKRKQDEEQRLLEEQKRQEEERRGQEEDRKKAEQKRILVEQQQEQLRQEEEKRQIAERERQQQEQRQRDEEAAKKRQEEEREKKRQAALRKQEEDKRTRLEEQRRVEEEQRRQEEENRRVEEQRRQEEQRKEEERIAEQKRKEEERRLAEEQRKEEERLAKEKREEEERKEREEEERRIAEQKKVVEEQRRREDEGRRAEEQRRQEQLKIEEENKRKEEETRKEVRRQEEERRIEEEKRRAEHERQGEEERKRREEEGKRKPDNPEEQPLSPKPARNPPMNSNKLPTRPKREGRRAPQNPRNLPTLAAKKVGGKGEIPTDPPLKTPKPDDEVPSKPKPGDEVPPGPPEVTPQVTIQTNTGGNNDTGNSNTGGSQSPASSSSSGGGGSGSPGASSGSTPSSPSPPSQDQADSSANTVRMSTLAFIVSALAYLV